MYVKHITESNVVYVLESLQNINFNILLYVSINFGLWSGLNKFIEVQGANSQLNP